MPFLTSYNSMLGKGQLYGLTLKSKTSQNQRDGIYRVGILEHFLPKSKQTPKPLISKES